MELCGTNNLVIGGTFYLPLDIHKIFCNFQNRLDKAQIDHLLVNRKWKRSLHDVRVRRGANVERGLQIVISMVKLKLQRCRNTTRHQRYFDVSKPRNDETSY